MINFDQVFISDYSLREATLSSIELMKEQIAEKYSNADRRYSQSDLATVQTAEMIAEREKFIKLRREKLLKDVWNKQHRYRTTFKVRVGEIKKSENDIREEGRRVSKTGFLRGFKGNTQKILGQKRNTQPIFVRSRSSIPTVLFCELGHQLFSLFFRFGRLLSPALNVYCE